MTKNNIYILLIITSMAFGIRNYCCFNFHNINILMLFRKQIFALSYIERWDRRWLWWIWEYTFWFVHILDNLRCMCYLMFMTCVEKLATLQWYIINNLNIMLNNIWWTLNDINLLNCLNLKNVLSKYWSW